MIGHGCASDLPFPALHAIAADGTLDRPATGDRVGPSFWLGFRRPVRGQLQILSYIAIAFMKGYNHK